MPQLGVMKHACFVCISLFAIQACVTGAPVALQNGTSSHTQGAFSVPETQDGIYDEFANGWAPDHAPSIAVWETTEDVSFPGGTELTFRLYQLYPLLNHTIGRFRLSYTTDDRSEFADSLQSGGDVTANWNVLVPVSVTATNVNNFTILDDGSVLAGNSTPTTTYVVVARTPAVPITGFRLEVLEHPSLPGNGPGFAGNKNLVLTEFEVDAQATPDSGAAGPLGIAVVQTPDSLKTVQLRWQAGPARIFGVEETSDFVTWSLVATPIIESAGGHYRVEVPFGATGSRFYRVR